MMNEHCRWLLTLLLMGLLLSSFATFTPSFAQTTGEESAEETESSLQLNATDVAEHVSVNDVTSDDAIRKRLKNILDATKWFESIEIEVRDSVTFLSGKTMQDDRKEWAGSLARNTEGVAAVVNRIQVEKAVDVTNTLKVVRTSVENLWKDFLYRLPLIVAGALVLFGTSLASRLANMISTRTLRRSRLRGSLQDLIMQLLTIVIWLVGLLIAAIIIFPGMTPSKALAVLGLGSVAVGFAFKDIFENFFAGILILWKYPFDKGDFIQCGGIDGKIEDITIRNPLVRPADGQLVVAPNALLFKNAVEVLTSRPSRRTTVVCGVAYDTDLELAKKTLETAVNSCSTVSFDLPVEIFAQEFADSSINFEITWWSGSTPLKVRESRDEVVRKVKHALDQENIVIPFPQRTHWFAESIAVSDQRKTGNGNSSSS